MKVVNVSHGNCADGFMAAWVVRLAQQEGKLGKGIHVFSEPAQVEPLELVYYPGVYQQDPPMELLKDAVVLITDFSYKRPVMNQIAMYAKRVIVIDHHLTAQSNLEGLDSDFPNVEVHFNIKHSGAMLTWFHFFPNRPVPAMIKHVEDRDLWRFAMGGTRAIQANIFSYPYDFAVWDELVERIERDPHAFEKEGDAIERKHFKDIRELLQVCTRSLNIGGYLVPTANLPYTMASDAGHILAKEYTSVAAFAACYYQNKGGNYTFSLRSHGDFDVSAVAAKYGGGGHKNAAGFTIDWDRLGLNEILDGNLRLEDPTV